MTLKKMVGVVLVAVLVPVISGCEAEITLPPPIDLLQDEEVAAVNAGTQRPLVLEQGRYDVLLMSTDTVRRRFEPHSGIYLGAYIRSDRAIGGIAAFEELTGVTHAIFAHNMAAGEMFPFMWILEMAAAMRTPLVTVQPADRRNPFDLELIAQTAQDAGRFNLPIFINLFPVSRMMGFDSTEYIAFFREAREIFAKYAPNAAMVWSVHFEDVFARAEQFYPGSEYVDWAGISVFADINSDNEHVDIMRHVNHFYFLFQREHPIMLTEFGVSNFTTTNFSFHTRQAAAEIERVYGAIAANFPRIKAIVYASFDHTDFATGRNLNNYRITGEAVLIESYARAALNPRFISSVDAAGEGRQDVTLKSPFRIADVEGVLFLPKNALIHDFGFSDTALFEGAEKVIGGNKYISLQIVQHHTQLEFFVNRNTRTVLAFGSQ